MIAPDIQEKIKKDLQNADIFFNESMKNHTSFKVGGAAELFLRPQNADALRDSILFLKEHLVPFIVIGNGSNLVAPDEGIKGAVITTMGLCDISIDGELLFAGSGALLSKIAAAALKHSLTGMEFAAGIPGTIGGAVFMNAGAYDGEMKDIVKESYAIDESGREFILNNEQHDFSYRKSAYSENGLFITGVVLHLKKGEPEKISSKMEEFSRRRKEKQPLEFPSAGSVFKRPEGYFAGKLIEDAGLKGARIGGAEVSLKHAGFIVNRGNATAEDIKKLVEYIKSEVYKKFSIELACEIKFL